MRFFKLVILSAAVISLTACDDIHNPFSSRANDYIHEGRSVQPVSPEGDNESEHPYTNYYPAPKNENYKSYQSTKNLTTPPGEQTKKYKRSSPPPSTARAGEVVWGQTKGGKQALIYKEPAQDSWNKVGSALEASGYKVLDKDTSMGTYVIGDTKKSGGQVTQSTPMYKVTVTPDGSNTEITVEDKGSNQAANPRVSRNILGSVKRNLK